MKKIGLKVVMMFMVMTALTGVFSFEAYAKNESKATRILFIGNSYTYYYNMSGTFAAMAVSEGKSISVCEISKSGYSMKEYANTSNSYGAQVYEKLTTQKWDYVILQENSVNLTNNCESDSYPYIRKIAELAENAGAQVVIYMVPTYSKEFTWTDSDDLTYEYSPTQRMYLLGKNTYSIANEIGAKVAAVGYSFEFCKNVYEDVNLYYKDNVHPSYAGSYLAASVIYSTVFEESPLGIDYIPQDYTMNSVSYSIDEETVQKMQKIADYQIVLSEYNFDICKSESKYIEADICCQEENDIAQKLDIRWYSLDDDVAIVDYKTGRITGLSVGTAQIMASTGNGLAAICTVNVKQPAQKVVLDTSAGVKVNIGDTVSYIATAYPLDTTDGEITWSSKDEEVATVDENGNVTALSSGKVVISATAANGVSATVTLKVRLATPQITSVKRTIKNLETNKTNIKIKWGKVDKADAYEVYRATKTTGYKLVATVTGNSFNDTNRACGKTFYYRIKAVSNTTSINGIKSDVVTMFVPKQVVLSATRESKRVINLSWKKVTGADGYVIYRSTSATKGFKKIKTIKSGTVKQYSNVKLSNKTYYYKVRAYKVIDGKRRYGMYSQVCKVKKI